MGVCNCYMFCCTLLYVPSSVAIILMEKRELVALLSLSSWCLVIVVWLYLAVPWVCLQFVIFVFPDLTHLLFVTANSSKISISVVETVVIVVFVKCEISKWIMTFVFINVYGPNADHKTIFESLCDF